MKQKNATKIFLIAYFLTNNKYATKKKRNLTVHKCAESTAGIIK